MSSPERERRGNEAHTRRERNRAKVRNANDARKAQAARAREARDKSDPGDRAIRRFSFARFFTEKQVKEAAALVTASMTGTLYKGKKPKAQDVSTAKWLLGAVKEEQEQRDARKAKAEEKGRGKGSGAVGRVIILPAKEPSEVRVTVHEGGPGPDAGAVAGSDEGRVAGVSSP